MALHHTARWTWDLGCIPRRWAGQQDAPRIQIQSSGLLRYKDLGLGFSPVGSRQQIRALLILPMTNPPARRMSAKPDQLSKGSRCQQAECALWQRPALSFGTSKGLQSGVAVVNLLQGSSGSSPGCQGIYLSAMEIHVLSLRRCMSYSLHGYWSAGWVGLFIF